MAVNLGVPKMSGISFSSEGLQTFQGGKKSCNLKFLSVCYGRGGAESLGTAASNVLKLGVSF
jgi:hypothetical protein